MNGAGQGLKSTGVGSEAATRPDTKIRMTAANVSQEVGRVRVMISECETFRSRAMGFYEDSVVKNEENVPQEHRCDLDELNHQVNQLNEALDILANSLHEIMTL